MSPEFHLPPFWAQKYIHVHVCKPWTRLLAEWLPRGRVLLIIRIEKESALHNSSGLCYSDCAELRDGWIST